MNRVELFLSTFPRPVIAKAARAIEMLDAGETIPFHGDKDFIMVAVGALLASDGKPQEAARALRAHLRGEKPS